MKLTWRIALLIALAALAIGGLFLLPSIAQDPTYHNFADHRAIFRIPNFWNVVSNLPFLMVAMFGFFRVGQFAEAWERRAHMVLLGALALVALGSSYYHLHPTDDTLFWDRLPMAVVFMALLAITMGERVNSQAGRLMFLPLLVIGAGSLLVWLGTGDLRAYVLVQFYPMVAVPLMLSLFPPRYTGTPGLWAMVAFYVLAKIFELTDYWIWNVAAPLSGHPWKHVAGAAAMFCYVLTVRERGLLTLTDPAPTSSDNSQLPRASQTKRPASISCT